MGQCVKVNEMPIKDRKASVMAAAEHGGVRPCGATGLGQDEGCAGCCLWGAMPGPASLEGQHVRLVIANVRFPKGAGLYREGEVGTELHSLRSGLVKLARQLPNGTERIVRLLRAGDVAGLEILRHPAYRHTAVALEPVNACRIRKASMAELDRLSPRLHEELMGRWERSLESADWWITQLSTGPVDARVARLIRFLTQAEGASPGHRVKLPPQGDMASMLGVATETVCRTLAGLQQAGTLCRVSSGLYTFDAAAIERLAGR